VSDAHGRGTAITVMYNARDYASVGPYARRMTGTLPIRLRRAMWRCLGH